MVPCVCGKPAVMEKQGKSLCLRCAKNYIGRVYPIREAEDLVESDFERRRRLAYRMQGRSGRPG